MNEIFTFFWNGPFSQWFPCSFVEHHEDDKGMETFNCAEQYMMVQKARLFKDEETMIKIFDSDHPAKMKALGRYVKGFDQKIWDEYKYNIVYKGNWFKFTQNKILKGTLLSTDGTTLVEASPYDCIWGIGLFADDPKAKDRKTWRGQNLLGEILTKVREDIKKGE